MSHQLKRGADAAGSWPTFESRTYVMMGRVTLGLCYRILLPLLLNAMSAASSTFPCKASLRGGSLFSPEKQREVVRAQPTAHPPWLPSLHRREAH